MKEIFNHYFNEHPDASDAEYQDWRKSQDDCCGGDCHCEGESATQEDKESQHDAWWNSLTDEQKQHLFEEQEAMEKDNIELSIEEMNHDLNFGK